MICLMILLANTVFDGFGWIAWGVQTVCNNLVFPGIAFSTLMILNAPVMTIPLAFFWIGHYVSNYLSLIVLAQHVSAPIMTYIFPALAVASTLYAQAQRKQTLRGAIMALTVPLAMYLYVHGHWRLPSPITTCAVPQSTFSSAVMMKSERFISDITHDIHPNMVDQALKGLGTAVRDRFIGLTGIIGDGIVGLFHEVIAWLPRPRLI